MISNKYLHRSKKETQEHLNFRKKICKNPFMKNYILEQNNNKCNFCNKEIEDVFALHHKSYNNQCRAKETVRLQIIDNKGNIRNVSVPNCEVCHKEHSEDFFFAVRLY